MTESVSIVKDWLASRVDGIDADLMVIIKSSVDSNSKILGNYNVFHTMIGYCIKEWANVEDALFAIFHSACEISLLRAAIIYYKTPNIDSRLTLTDEIVQSIMPQANRKSGGHKPAITKEWINLKTQINSLLKVRNDIAHKPLYFVIETNDQGDIEDDARSWWQIAESHAEQQRGRSAGKKSLELIDLVAHWIKVSTTYKSLRRFNSVTLSAHISKPKKPSHTAGND